MSFDFRVVPFAVSLIINLLLFGSAILVGVWVAFKLTRAAPPRVRYVVAVTAFFAAAFLPIVASLRVNGEPESLLLSVLGGNQSGVDDAHVAAQVYVSGGTAITEVSRLREAPTLLASGLNDFAQIIAQSSWAVLLTGLWAAVAVLMCGREALSHLRLRRARREWQPAALTVRRKLSWPEERPLYVHEYEGPCAVGLLRPAAVIPTPLLSRLE